MKTAALLSLMLITAAPAFAEQASTPRQNPYSRLFQVREMLKQSLEEKRQPLSASKPRIVCGMTVIETTPSIDPKMGVTPPKDGKTRYTIRAIEPPICR